MRLTKDIKTAILNAALKKSGVTDRESAIRSRYADFAESVRLLFVTDEVNALVEAAEVASKSVPSQIRDYSFNAYRRPYIECNVAGMSRRFNWNGTTKHDDRDKGVTRLCPAYDVVVDAGNPLVEKLYAIDHDAAALKSEREQLTLSLWAVLDSVTTDKRLIEVWPEAVAFIPAAERAATSNLPALPIADLNKMIGLP